MSVTAHNGVAHCVPYDGFVDTMQSKGGESCNLSRKDVIRSSSTEGTYVQYVYTTLPYYSAN